MNPFGGLGIGWIAGINPIEMIGLMQGMGGGSTTTQATRVEGTTSQDKQVDFVHVVMASTEDVWQDIFAQQLAGNYQDPEMVLYTGSVGTACGTGQVMSPWMVA